MQKTSAPELTTRLSTITRERKDSWDQLRKIWRSAMVESPEKRATKQAAKNCKENLRHKKPHRTYVVSIIISGEDDTQSRSQNLKITQKWILIRKGRRSPISKGASTPQNMRRLTPENLWYAKQKQSLARGSIHPRKKTKTT